MRAWWRLLAGGKRGIQAAAAWNQRRSAARRHASAPRRGTRRPSRRRGRPWAGGD
jgi:hypothetical protein